MPLFSLMMFLFFGLALVSLWVKRDLKIWASLFGLSLLSALIAGHINLFGVGLIVLLWILWHSYKKKSHPVFFLILVALSLVIRNGLFNAFPPFIFTPKFLMGINSPTIGLFPLAFFVPLVTRAKEFKDILKGILLGLAGIAVLALGATLANATHWQFKLPSYPLERVLSNFFLTCIPQEGFYRGFIQSTLAGYFNKLRFGNGLAIGLTSLVFTSTHLSWSPNIQILAFVFLASLLYGWVYQVSKKIESAILVHFLLNMIHMTFFTYHAM